MENTTLSQRIKSIIKEQKIKSIDFAKSLGITSNYVSLLSTGKKTTISETLALLIEKTYGYNKDWVLTGETPKYPEQRLSVIKDEMVELVKNMNTSDLLSLAEFIDGLKVKRK